MCVRRFADFAQGTLAATLLLTAGCMFTLGSRDDEKQPPDVPPTSITIKVVNDTDKPLDPEIYVGPVADGVDRLFRTANKHTSFGFAGLGVLEPRSQASSGVDCEGEVYIATRGGIFGDDLRDPLDRGQQIVLQQELSVHCGDVVRFTFSASGSNLTTSVSIEAP